MHSHSLLYSILNRVDHRYRIPRHPELVGPWASHPASLIAVILDQVDEAFQEGRPVPLETKSFFLDALAALIHEALHPLQGDAVFQSMVLEHQSDIVRHYLALVRYVNQDVRSVHAVINRVAHPQKLKQFPLGPVKEALTLLHASSLNKAWSSIESQAKRLLLNPAVGLPSAVDTALHQLLDGGALARLTRVEVLSSEAEVMQYLSLRHTQGPQAGSDHAFAQGALSKQRGAAVERHVAQVLEALAAYLNSASAEKTGFYRVITSVHADATLPASKDYAKGEWDAMLLHGMEQDATVWDVCLIVEVKAAVDAATGDLPRLLRGLRVLRSAEASQTYVFQSMQGPVRLHGESLKYLPDNETDMATQVLYCSDALADEPVRLLSHASRMQLLSHHASVAYAADVDATGAADLSVLRDVWDDVCFAPSGQALRQQYRLMYQARALMVHIDDVSALLPH